MTNKTNKETVVLLHGIGHSLWNMTMVERALQKDGYVTLNLSYPSRKHGMAYLAQWLADTLDAQDVWQKSSKVHFVGHSMGGLVIGMYLQNHRAALPKVHFVGHSMGGLVIGMYLQNHRAALPLDKMGRVVMLGTPHGGSEVADGLKDNMLYQFVFGPAGQELTTATRLKDKIKPWYDLGVIAGTQNWMYPLGQAFIKDDNDGCVSVESTKLEGMKDHIVLPVMHGFMGWDGNVHRQITAFLRGGRFDRD
jgi:pimeloyl-ACP methyl ester carboxylesterase